MKGRLRRSLLVLSLAATLVALLPGAAAGVTISVSASIRYTSCQRNLAWQGSVFYIWGTQNKGTVDHCLTLLKVSDSDSTADYYVVDYTAEWEVTYNDQFAPGDNYASVTVTSSVAAKGSVYAASRTVTSSSCWESPVAVGTSFAGFSVTVRPVLCDSGTLRRDSVSSTGAKWSSDNIKKTPFWETAYMIKVGQGVKPHFSVILRYPRYTKYQDGGRYCGGGYCVPTYSYTKKWTGIGWGVTVP